MSELPPPAAGSEQSPGSRLSSTDDDLRSRLLRLVMAHLAAMAVLGIAAAAVLATNPSDVLRYSVLGGGLVGCAAIAIIAFNRVNTTAAAVERQIAESSQRSQKWIDESAQHTQRWIESLRATVEQGKNEFPRLVEQVRAGEPPAPRWPADDPAPGSHPFALLSHEIRQAQAAAEFAVARLQQVPGTANAAEPSVAVFANIARRVQSLAHRAIQRLDELEQMVEDPDLLKGLFAVDHLVTGMRRQAESLAVLGGSMPRRQWSRPIPMYTALRSSVAEVEHYARVKVLPPVEGTLHGHAVADVIHLIAELVENATAFSEPDTEVTVSTQRVTAGLAIDIRDRGLGMRLADRAKLNALLADPSGVDRDEQLKDGRIGLYVVAQLAQRHHVAVELENNMYGGTDAHVVVPLSLLGDADEEPHHASAVADGVANTVAAPEPQPAIASTPALPATPQAERGGAHRAPVEWEPVRQFDASVPAASNGNGTTRWYGRHTGIVPDAVAEDVVATPPGNVERPPLPKRDRAKSYVAPQLAGGPRPAEAPRGGPNPGLWAAYRHGAKGGARDNDGSGDHSA
ncbi:sensor histidine kinase [Saccharopolyspora elongata]|uniref:histidine kinase n=1 Tax=Saccharopolyspora elongata TaxID=2530387 RepID=A0A4R4YWN9_9PSEU|nr:ATP-binding protein [Saccharopolyspora elongata]TDD48964.1 ATP-binding protein [Saccharopolyspora elongata]